MLMANINEILARAAALRDETALNSISPERAGGIMYDTLLALNELWLQQGAALVISKIYASVAAMEADTAPVSDLTGKPLRPGQIVVIASSDSDNGSVYRYNGTESPSWSLVGSIGNLDPVDSLDSDSTTLPLAAHQGKVLDGKISQLGQAQIKLFVTQLMDSNGIKNTIDAVYGSSTDNFLDIENVIYGLGLYHNGSTSMFLYGDKGSITSRLIPVNGASKVTISGYTKNDLFVQFLFSREIKYNWTYTYRLTGTSRTINVPSGAIYMLVGLQSKTDSPHDYSNMKVSLSDSAAVGTFTPVFYGYAGYSDLLQKTIMSWEDFSTKVQYQSQSKNILDTSVPFSKVRVSYTEPYFVFDNSIIISYPIYVKGRDKITWTTTYPSLVFTRYIAFCTDDSMTDASVIEVKDPGFNISSTSKQVKTIPVPPTAVYMFVNIGNRNSESQAYKNDTIVFGEEETDEQYVPVAFKVNEIPFYPDAKFQEIDKKLEEVGGTIDFIKETERTNTLKRYIPYSVGSPSASAGWSGQYERLNLLFFTDNHIDTPSANPIPSRQNVSDVYDFVENCPIALDAIINAGDTITPFGVTTKPVQKASIGHFFNECKRIETIPTLYSVGNHDTNDWFNYKSNAFTDDDWSEMWYDWAEQTYGIVRQAKSSGKKSTWHYYDIESKKVRIICIDVMDADKSIVNENNKVVYYGGVGFYISNEQFNWVANTALNFDDKDEKDWGVIIVSHVGTTYGVNCKDANDGNQIQSWVSGTSYAVGELVKESNVSYRCIEANSDAVFDNSKWKELNPEKDIDKFSLMLKAFNEQSTYSESYTFSGDSYFNLSVSADWTRYSNLEKKPYIICWLIGHEHTDKNTAINGIQMIWSLNGSCTIASSDNRVARIPGSSTQNSFDLISIDLKDKKIRIVKYGAGVTCYGAGGDRFLPDGLSF